MFGSMVFIGFKVFIWMMIYCCVEFEVSGEGMVSCIGKKINDRILI